MEIQNGISFLQTLRLTSSYAKNHFPTLVTGKIIKTNMILFPSSSNFFRLSNFFSHSSTIPRNNQGTMNAQDSSSLHRSNTPLLNNFNRSDLNDNKKDYHMVKPDSEDASKAVSIFYTCCTLKLRSSFQKIA